ncbi:hypothetical protein ACYZUA_18420 [Pseudomonas sp. LS2P72]
MRQVERLLALAAYLTVATHSISSSPSPGKPATPNAGKSQAVS